MNSKNFLLAACVWSLAFVSCINDEPKDDDQKPAEKVKHVECSIKIDFGGDLLEVADVTVNYLDNTGAQKSEVVTTKAWEKKETITTFPYQFKPQISLKAKSSVPSKEKYDLKFVSKVTFTTILTDGNEGLTGSKDGSLGLIGVGKEKLNVVLDNNTTKYIGGWSLDLSSDSTNIEATRL